MPEILKNIKAEDRLKKIRIVSENDDVMGGQPEADGMKENDNNAIFDLACSVMHALAEVAKVDQKAIPQILDALGDSRTAGASQRIVNEVNKLAKAAQTAANQANDKANTANTAAATADKKAVAAQNKADSAYNLANSKQDKLNFIGTGLVVKNKNPVFDSEIKIQSLLKDQYHILIHQNNGFTSISSDLLIFRYRDSGVLAVQVGNLKEVQYEIKFPTKTGTVALIEDIPSLTNYATKEFVESKAMGVNQKWTDVSSQRDKGIEYTNTTGKPIQLNIYVSHGASVQRSVFLYVDEVGFAATLAGINAIIPPNSRYLLQISGGAIINGWSELR
ncbi:hypothetical protein B9T10_02275 [Wohlfahrtiimonas chitiniclastica]|uniref:hypothetical protein n=1 Tax=Wohlfahrtiimonas chitiniclastica TaxID=400946 RepID=UPI000B97EAE4|nr:hypothetical protein [Wohlfahrtiimonas chitiniclastica]OYQ90168.1 hypothetical protein B9T10_02275 [Wohlfahrtiimonas chitiniclastica]